MSQVRAAALTHFDQVAGSVGLEPGALLRSAQLGPALLGDPERLLPCCPVANLLEAAAQQSGCDHFGLLMAEKRSLASFGPLSLLLRHLDRVGDVVQALVRYQSLFGGAFRVQSDAFDDAMLVRFEMCAETRTRQGMELVLGCFCRCIAAVLGRPWSPESVHLSHGAPNDPRPHQRLLACPIDFDSDFNGIVFTREMLEEANPAGDGRLVEHAERLLSLIVPRSEPSTASERVRHSLRSLLPEQRGTFDEVAWDMSLKPRSLQRLLEGEGCRFGALLNEVRRELAQRYLGAAWPVGVVANMTGFRRASSFTRWFGAEFGMAPAEWRRAARRPTGPGPAGPAPAVDHLVRGLTGMVGTGGSGPATR